MFWKVWASGLNAMAPLRNGIGGKRWTPNSVAIAKPNRLPSKRARIPTPLRTTPSTTAASSGGGGPARRTAGSQLNRGANLARPDARARKGGERVRPVVRFAVLEFVRGGKERLVLLRRANGERARVHRGAFHGRVDLVRVKQETQDPGGRQQDRHRRHRDEDVPAGQPPRERGERINGSGGRSRLPVSCGSVSVRSSRRSSRANTKRTFRPRPDRRRDRCPIRGRATDRA